MSHAEGIETILEWLSEKPYLKSARRNVDFGFGEADVFSVQGDKNRHVYYEFKSHHHEHAYTRGRLQLQRTTYHLHDKNMSINYYGVYITPEYMELVCKNGVFRNAKHTYKNTLEG